MSGRKTKQPARVLIADDHPAVREASALRVGGQPDLAVGGTPGVETVIYGT